MSQEQYAELAESAGVFVHEIKNHLNTLSVNLQMLGEDFADPQSHRERRALERIRRLQTECNRLVEVSNDFLRFTRVKELERVPVDLGKLVDELIDFFGGLAQDRGLTIRCYIPADLPVLSLDRGLIEQALLNLLLNARDAMPNGGQLTIQATAEPNAIALSLIDTGIGMSPKVLANAFKPFYSTRSGGTGLGLPTTRKIIEAHGGSIHAESEVGRGTKFTIRLPLEDAPTSPC